MKMITHRGLDCCASLNIGGGALLALHWRAPVGTSLQQLLFHNLINSTVNGDHWSPSLWMFSQWFFTRVLHCYHWPLWIYFQHSFFTHLVVSSSWQVDFITLMQTWNELVLCASWHQLSFEFRGWWLQYGLHVTSLLTGPHCSTGTFSQTVSFTFLLARQEVREGLGWVT